LAVFDLVQLQAFLNKIPLFLPRCWY